MNTGVFIIGLALTVILLVGCIGGDHDTLAPRGPSSLRIIYLATDRSVPLASIIMDGRSLWTPLMIGAASERWDVGSGTHAFSISGTDAEDSVFAFSVMQDLYSNIEHTLIFTGDADRHEAIVTQDRLHPSLHDPQIRFVNALAESQSIDVKDQYGVPYFIGVNHNQVSAYRAFSDGAYAFYAYHSDSIDVFLGMGWATLNSDTIYTLILSGSDKYLSDPQRVKMRLFVDTPSADAAAKAKQ